MFSKYLNNAEAIAALQNILDYCRWICCGLFFWGHNCDAVVGDDCAQFSELRNRRLNDIIYRMGIVAIIRVEH